MPFRLTADIRARVAALTPGQARAVIWELVLAVYDNTSGKPDPQTNAADLLDDLNTLLSTNGIHPITLEDA